MIGAQVAMRQPDAVADALELARAAWLDVLDDDHIYEKPMNPYLATVRGSLGDDLYQMDTRCFQSEQYAQIVVAEIRDGAGRLRTFTVVGLPRGQSSAPVVGVDLIGLRGALTLCAFDLAPTNRPFWSQHCKPALQHLAQEVEDLPRRKLPDFAQHTFSEDVVIVAARRGQEIKVASAAHSLAFNFRSISRAASRWRFPHAAIAIRTWCESELQNRKEAAALGRLFGADFADHYLRGFLFNTEAYY